MIIPVMSAIKPISVVFDAIIIVAELIFFLVFLRFVFFNGEWKNYSIFTKVITIFFTILVILILVAIFLSAARVE